MSKRLAYILIFLSISSSYFAQNYPVQAFLQVSPPHTSYLPEYANPTTNQMKVLLTLTDFTVPSHQVKLRFKFEGNGYTIENPVYLNSPAFTLTPGTPFEVSGADLAYYLNSANLLFSGIDPNDYEHRKVLPEGPCTICVEVLDYTSPTPTILANPACASVWFSLYDPPFLNTPMCGMEVPDTDPQQILFSWTPLNMASPTGFASTEYVFELFEIRPENSDPNIVVNSTLPIFVQVTQQPFVNYGITEPQLQLGMEYVWRVQVRDNTGKDHFKNQGYSQVCTFTYGNIASSVLNGIELQLESSGTGVRQGLAWWNGNAVFDEYVLEYRKTGNSAFQWFSEITTGNQQKMNSLEPETEYECRVKGLAAGEASEWSNTSTFVTQPPRNYECNDGTAPLQQPNVVPLINAIEGMVFTVGQFEMMVTSITPLGVPGHYTGTGKITIPFALINLNVSFDDILVDDNLAVRQGKVEAISQGMDAWEHQIEIDACLENPHYFAGVDSITFPENGGAIVHFQGTTYTIDTLPAALYTDDGYVYYIFEDGTYEVEFTGTISLDEMGASDSLQVRFQAKVGQQYGFDAFANGLWTNSYETIPLEDGTNYIVPFKSMLSGGTDQVMAIVDSKLPFTPDSILFKCLDGRVLAHEKLNSTTYRITLDQFTAEEEAVYAYWQGTKLGKLNVRAYDQLNEEVVIVPVNNAPLQNPDSLQNIVNSIYQQALVNWTVTIDSSFNHTAWDMDGNGKLANADDNAMSHYSSEMRALRDAYLDLHPDFDKNKRLLFVVEEFDQSSTKGYMVRGKGLGFLTKNPLGRTVAHELGHSFGLYHTFPHATKGSTANLLDYVLPAQLTKHQWEKIHQPSIHLSFLDDEEDAMSATIFNLEDLRPLFNDDSTSITFLSMGGKPITLTGNINYIEFSTEDDKWMSHDERVPVGTLYAFEIDNKFYKAVRLKYSSGASNLFGYCMDGNTDHPYIDSISHLNNYQFVNAGIVCIKNGVPIYKVVPMNPSVVDLVTEKNNKGEGPIRDEDHYASLFSNMANAVDITASFDYNYLDELQRIQSITGSDLCGREAIYALRVAHLLKKNPGITDECIDEIQRWSDAKAGGDFGMYQVNVDPNSGWSPSSASAYQVYQWPSKRVYVFYNQLKDYIELIESKDLSGTFNAIEGTDNTVAISFILNHYSISENDHNSTYSSYSERQCLLGSIPLDIRIKLLETLNQTHASFFTDKEQMIVDLIESTPPGNDQYDLINYLSRNKGRNFWNLYGDVYNNSSRERFMTVVSKMVYDNLPYSPQANVWIPPQESIGGGPQQVTFLKVAKDIKIGANGQVVPLGAVKTISISYVLKSDSSIRMQYYTHHTPDAHTEYYTYGSYFEGAIFDYVSVEFTENFQFASIEGEKINKGSRMVVPAVWLYWILDKQNSIETWANIRIAVNIGAALITAGTTTGLALAAELTFNGIDILVAFNEDDINSSNNATQQEYLNIYNTCAAIAAITVGGVAIFNHGEALVNGVAKFTKNKVNYVLQNVRGIPQKYDEYVVKFKELFQQTKSMPDGYYSWAPELRTFAKNTYLELCVGRYAGSLDEALPVVENGSELIVELTGNHHRIKIADIVTSPTLEIEHITNLRWYESYYNQAAHGDVLTTKALEFENLAYMDDAGNVHDAKKLEVVQTSGGQVFIRTAENNWITSNLLTKLNDLNDDLLKQKFIDDFAGASDDVKNTLNGNVDLVDAWEVLSIVGEPNLSNRIEDIQYIKDYVGVSGKTHVEVRIEIDGIGGYHTWKMGILENAILVGKRADGSLAKALDDAGFVNSGTAVRQANGVNRNNKRLLDAGDPDIPNAVSDYTFIKNGQTYSIQSNESWGEYFTRLKSNGFNVFESHHVFPIDLFKRKSFRTWFELEGVNHFDVNGNNVLDNLIMLEKKIVGNGGVHSRHDAYTNLIGDYFDQRWNELKMQNPNWSDSQIAQGINMEMVSLSRKIKLSLLENSVKSNVEVSKFWETVDFSSLLN